MSLTDALGDPTDTKLLRPRKSEPTHVESLCSAGDVRKGSIAPRENTTANLKQIEAMINKVTTEHLNESTVCKNGPKFIIAEKKPWGMSSKLKWKCENCSFVSKLFHKLYKEVESEAKPGCKAAEVNVGLAASLTGSSIGATGARDPLEGEVGPWYWLG